MTRGFVQGYGRSARIFLVRPLSHMPNSLPTVSAIFTGILALGLLLQGIGYAASPTGSPGGGIVLALLGVGLFGWVIYAAYSTDWFHNWLSPTSGTLRHPVVRWLGPVSLIVSIVVFAIMLQIILAVFIAEFRKW
jgi:hypothetical protein